MSNGDNIPLPPGAKRKNDSGLNIPLPPGAKKKVSSEGSSINPEDSELETLSTLYQGTAYDPEEHKKVKDAIGGYKEERNPFTGFFSDLAKTINPSLVRPLDVMNDIDQEMNLKKNQADNQLRETAITEVDAEVELAKDVFKQTQESLNQIDIASIELSQAIKIAPSLQEQQRLSNDLLKVQEKKKELNAQLLDSGQTIKSKDTKVAAINAEYLKQTDKTLGTDDPVELFSRAFWDNGIKSLGVSALATGARIAKSVVGAANPLADKITIDPEESDLLQNVDQFADKMDEVAENVRKHIPSDLQQSIFDGDFTANKAIVKTGEVLSSLAIIGGAGLLTGGSGAFITGGMLAADGMYKELKENTDLSEDQLAINSLMYGISVGQLEKMGVSKVLSPFTKVFTKNLAKKASKPIAAGAINKINNNLAKKAFSKTKEAATATVAEAATEGSEVFLEEGIKQFSDVTSGVDNFQLSLEQLGKNFAENAILGGYGGLLAHGGARTAALAFKPPLSDKTNYESIEELESNPEAKKVFFEQLEFLKDNGSITETQLGQTVKQYETSASAINEVPESLPKKDKEKAADLILEKKRVYLEEVEGKDDVLAQPGKDKIIELDNQLKSIINETKNKSRVSSREQKGQTPIEEKSDQEASRQADKTGRVLQEQKIDVKPIKTEKDVIKDESQQKEEAREETIPKEGKGEKTSNQSNQKIEQEEGVLATKEREEVLKSLDNKRLEVDEIIIGEKEEAEVKSSKPKEPVAQATIAPIKPFAQITKKAFGKLNKFQENTFGKIFDEKVQNPIAKLIQAGATSDNTILRNISQGLISWSNGLPRTENDISQKNKMVGGIQGAKVQMQENMKNLRKLINNDINSARRVHQLLDPEIYDDPISFDELNTEEKALFNSLRKINDYIHDYNFAMGFIDSDTYNKFKGKYIGRAYEPYEISEETEDFINKSDFSHTKRKLTFDLFKARKEIDDFKKENKVEDPIFLTAKRLMQTEQNAAILSYIDFIAKKKGFVSDEAKKGFTQLKGKEYGKLNDKYVPNYIAEDFKGFFFGNRILDTLYDAFQTYDRWQARQFFKKFHTVFTPTVQLGNATSNYVFSFLSGIDPVTYSGNIPKAIEQLNRKGKVYKLLVQNGVLQSDLLTKDLLPFTKKTIKELDTDIKDVNVIKRNFKKYKKLFSDLLHKDGRFKSVKNILSNADKDLIEVYQGSDDVAKIAAFMSLKEQGFSDQKAIDQVFRGFQNYSTVGKIWDAASKTPFIGNPFVKFKADLFRILKNAAFRRPLSTAMFIGILRGLADLASNWSDEDEELKEIREGRPFTPKIPLPGRDVSLVFKTPMGEVNLARYLSPYYIYDLGERERPIEFLSNFLPIEFQSAPGAAKGTFSTLPETNDVLLGSLAALFLDRDFRGKSISDPKATRYKSSGLTTGEKRMNMLNYLLRSQVPYFSNIQDLYLSTTEGRDFFGRRRDLSQTLMNNFIKIQKFENPEYKKVIQRDLESSIAGMDKLTQELKGLDTSLNNEVNEIAADLQEEAITEKQAQNRVKKVMANYDKRKLAKEEDLVEKQIELEEKVLKYKNILEKL